MPEFATAPALDERANVLAARGVHAHAPNGRRLLQDVSVTVGRGETLAVVGPTGAGKTSLARALTGALTLDEGSVRVEGRVAFVPQEDALHGGLTLDRALRYAARLRLPDATAAERDARVMSVLDELGLTAHADTTIGNLSGGQRKRASIAAVLVGDPDVLVLDEPTAGLDPGYEKVVVDSLRALAENGRTVITVTHSVDVMRASDRVLFLAGGRVAFLGTPKEATRYFRQDLADVFLSLDTTPELWVQKFAARRAAATSAPDAAGAVELREAQTSPRRAPRQLAWLLRRQVDILRADRRHLLLLALQAPLVGALLWAVLPGAALRAARDGSYGSKAGVALLFIVLSSTWLGVANAIRDVVRERSITRWEGAAGLSPRAYIQAKFLVLGGLSLVQGVVVGSLATGRQHAAHRPELIAITAFAGVAATALGLVVSSLAKSTDRASALLPVTLVGQLVLAGEWASSARLPLLHQVRWIVSSRWAVEAMAATLNGPASQRTRDLIALVLLTAFCVEASMAAVARLTCTSASRRPVAARFSWRPQVVGAALPATVVAVLMTLGASGAGVMALAKANGSHTQTTTAAHFAAAPVHTATSIAPSPPTTAVTAPPVTAPPVTAPPAVTKHTPATILTTPVTVPPVLSTVDNIVATTPTTIAQVLTPPTTVPAPATTPTTANPWSNWYKMFTPFSPNMSGQ